MPVSIPAILETQQLAIASCDTMNLDTGDISNTGKSTGAQTNATSNQAQIEAINASSETFKALGDLTQLINPIVAELNDIVTRVNAKLKPYEDKVKRAEQEQQDIASSNGWYSTAISAQNQIAGDAQTVIDGLDSNDPGYADSVATQQAIIDAANAQIDVYNDELDILNGDYAADWEEFRAYHQAVVDDIIATFNTIMAPVRAAFEQARSAIETANTNISSGKNTMLDMAADIAKNIAKTAGKAVTQAIGDIAENSRIMKPIDEPVTFEWDGNDTFRGARDTKKFLGREWDGVTIPNYVTIIETQEELDAGLRVTGTYNTHVFQPGTEHRNRRHAWLMPIDGKVHAYPIRLDNEYILGREVYSYVPTPALNTPGWSWISNSVMVGWWSDTPGGPPRLDTEGNPLVILFDDIEKPKITCYQVYSLTDANYYDATGSGGRVPYSEYTKGDPYVTPGQGVMVFPVVTRTYFWNMATVSPDVALRIISPVRGVDSTKNNIARAPLSSELKVIDKDLLVNVGLPAFIGRGQTNRARSFDEGAGMNPDYELFDEYVERNRVVLEPEVTSQVISGTDYNDQYIFRGSTYAGLSNPYNYTLPEELTPDQIYDSVGRGKFNSPSFGTKMSIGLTVPPVTPDDTYSEDKFFTYGNMAWSSNTFVVDPEGEQLALGLYALVIWVSDTPGGTSRGIGRNYIVTDPNTEYYNKVTLINDTKYWQGEYDYFKTVTYPLSWVGNSASGGTQMTLDLINPSGDESEVRFINFALVKNDANTFTDYDSENPTKSGVNLAAAPGTAEFDNFVFTPDVATWQSESFNTIATYVDSIIDGAEVRVVDDEVYPFKNERVVRGATNEGFLTNVFRSTTIGQYELAEQPSGTTNNFDNGNAFFTVIRVLESDLIEFFNPDITDWSDGNTEFFLRNHDVDDPRFPINSYVAPTKESKSANRIKYKLKDRISGDLYETDGDGYISNGDRFDINTGQTTGDGPFYRRIIIQHPYTPEEELTGEVIGVNDKITNWPIYDVQNWYFGYLEQSDVETVEYLPWQAAKESGNWGAKIPIDTVYDETGIFISKTSGNFDFGPASDYHYEYLKPNALEYVWHSGRGAYRIYFERNNGDNGAFQGEIDKNSLLTFAQEKTAAEIAREEAEAIAGAGSKGIQPFIATDGVLTYDTSERATADFRAGIYPTERLVRINNFRRSEDVGLGELFIVAGVNWMPVNEWEEAWRERTGRGIDVEDQFNVVNNVQGVRPAPIDTTDLMPAGIPEYTDPPKSKTLVVGDRTISLGQMNPITDLISGADAYERATKEHLQAIAPLSNQVEAERIAAVQATAGLAGFDAEKLQAKKNALAVEIQGKKLVSEAETSAAKAKFDFVAVTANMFSNSAKSAANTAKSLANRATPLLESARAAIISTCAIAFPQLEALIARPEPPVRQDLKDITSGDRITGTYP